MQQFLICSLILLTTNLQAELCNLSEFGTHQDTDLYIFGDYHGPIADQSRFDQVKSIFLDAEKKDMPVYCVLIEAFPKFAPKGSALDILAHLYPVLSSYQLKNTEIIDIEMRKKSLAAINILGCFTLCSNEIRSEILEWGNEFLHCDLNKLSLAEIYEEYEEQFKEMYDLGYEFWKDNLHVHRKFVAHLQKSVDSMNAFKAHLLKAGTILDGSEKELFNQNTILIEMVRYFKKRAHETHGELHQNIYKYHKLLKKTQCCCLKIFSRSCRAS